MFGIARPCRRHTTEDLYRSWMAHLCGLCLTLRDEHGQLARLATNVDGLLLSVLVDAQAPRPGRSRMAGPCLLRHLRTATVAASAEPGIRYAAAVSLVAAAARTQDHILDSDGPLRWKPAAAMARRFADGFAAAGARSAAAVGFDPQVLTEAVRNAHQRELAARPGSSVLAVTQPTEDASAAAFAYTATLADRPHNRKALAEAGRLFGRLVHLLDAVMDQPTDRAKGIWNPLDATGTSLCQAAEFCQDAFIGLCHAVRQLDLRDGRLVELLLVHEVRREVIRTFVAAGFERMTVLTTVKTAIASHGTRRDSHGSKRNKSSGSYYVPRHELPIQPQFENDDCRDGGDDDDCCDDCCGCGGDDCC